MPANKRTKIVIAGGSLAGLMTGIELAQAGVEVQIYERSERVLDDRGAGIVMQPDTEYILTRRCGLPREKIGVELAYRQHLNKDGSQKSHQLLPQTMTSWGLIYSALRSTFPKDKYRTGTPLESFNQEADRVVMRFKGIAEVTADCLVGADGARSLVRKTLFPDLEPVYAGYVAWRGVVPEAKAGEQLLSAFAGHFTFQQMWHSHVLCYMIPGLQPILDLDVANMVNRRTALVGDAAFIPRPHTAGSTSKAAANAIALGKMLSRPDVDLPDALNEWQKEQLDLGWYLVHHGKALGDRSQFN